MPTPPRPIEQRQRYKDAVEACLRDGFSPYRSKTVGKGSCMGEAIKRLNEQGFPITRSGLHSWLRMEEKHQQRNQDHFVPDWSLFSPPGLELGKARTGKVHRWILTAAQDDTDVHQRFWTNLQALANAIGAQISVAGLTYQTRRHSDRETLSKTYRPELKEFLRFDPMDCGPVLWCAEMNTLVTASRPLSSLEGYSRGRDAVFPHSKHHYMTVPQAAGDHVPSLLTTGVVTVENYIDKKAGLKARFHHILGAVVVEVDGHGDAWCYQIQAAPDGSFQHLDFVVRDGIVRRNNRIEAVVHGDIHLPFISEDMVYGIWGHHTESLMDALKPKFQFFHDVLDIRAYSRHNENDHFHHAEMEVAEQLDVPDLFRTASEFLGKTTAREYCRSVWVNANHDRRFDRWCRNNLPASESIHNSIFWHEARIAQLSATRDRDEDFDLLLWAMKRFNPHLLENLSYVPHGGSFLVCQDSGGIECGWHGDDGPNGARATPTSYAKMARRITRGHAHSPSILDGTHTVGMLGDLDQGYNKGPSSWKHASGLVYPNGKRTLVTFTKDGKWRAA